MKRSPLIMTSVMTLQVATTASAEITGASVVEYSLTDVDFEGSEVTVNVLDLFSSPPATSRTAFRASPVSSWLTTED